jgi:hypothetical protein
VRHGVKAYSREVVALGRLVLTSRFLHLLPNRFLRFGRKGPQHRRGGRGRLGQIASVGILIGERPTEGNLLYLGLGKPGTQNELADAPRVGHGEGAGRLGIGGQDMPL